MEEVFFFILLEMQYDEDFIYKIEMGHIKKESSSGMLCCVTTA